MVSEPMPEPATAMTCPCCSAQPVEFDAAIGALQELRDRCPALSQILIPAEISSEYFALAGKLGRKGGHSSVIFEAFLAGNLRRLTAPIHRFLLPNGAPHASLSPNWRQDLKERWILESDVKKRDRQSNMFSGKLVELLFAENLVRLGESIVSLEALGGQHDITSGARPADSVNWEVKWIGLSPSLFNRIYLESADGVSSGTNSPYGAANYFLWRVLEAADQLAKSGADGRVIVIIEHDAWPFLHIPVSEHWAGWNPPRFFENAPDWRYFVDRRSNAKRLRRWTETNYCNLSRVEKVRVLTLEEDLSLLHRHTFGFPA